MHGSLQQPQCAIELQHCHRAFLVNGNGAQLVRLTDNYLERNGDGSYPNLTEANLAVNCVDQAPSQLPVTFAEYQQQFPKLEQVSKHFGPAFATGLSCEFWQAKPDPLSVPRAAGSPPLLVVDTTGDPATPYEWGQAVSKELSSARLLTFNGADFKDLPVTVVDPASV